MAFQISPLKESSGRVAQPVVVSYRLGWYGITEPKRRGKTL
ncbi:MAG: hypothetical protein DIU64_002760 [Caldicoprobacter oshimai]